VGRAGIEPAANGLKVLYHGGLRKSRGTKQATVFIDFCVDFEGVNLLAFISVF
jgi:hypothetical protein